MIEFSKEESDVLKSIILNRRDVRGNRFLEKKVSKDCLQQILEAGIHAPSVGFSQPWEFVIVESEETKSKIRQVFDRSNSAGSEQFEGNKKNLYNEMKLEGILEAPINIAVFYKPSQKPVLGQTAMSEMGKYSVVCAIQNMWLMARSLNIGLGWVSILDQVEVKNILHVPEDRELIGYLCLGYVDLFHEKPELELKNWETRKSLDEVVFYEGYKND